MVIPPHNRSHPEAHKVMVFCGSHSPHDMYDQLAYDTGVALAKAGYVTVTGGGPGMMLEVNKGAREGGGESWGLCLTASEEMHHVHLTNMELFETVHDRHREMFRIGDAFVALPGGLGTMVDALHVTQMKKFGEINMHVPLIFVGEYYHGLNELFDQMKSHHFIKEKPHEFYTHVITADQLVGHLQKHLKPLA